MILATTGRMNFRGIVESLEKHSERKRIKLEQAKGTPRKKRRIELKKNHVIEGTHGHGTYYGRGSEDIDRGNEMS